jgi:hypothetical protein
MLLLLKPAQIHTPETPLSLQTIILNAAISNQDSTRYDCERHTGSKSMNATGAHAHLLPASYVAREFVYGHVVLMRSEDARPSRLRYFRSRTTFVLHSWSLNWLWHDFAHRSPEALVLETAAEVKRDPSRSSINLCTFNGKQCLLCS